MIPDSTRRFATRPIARWTMMLACVGLLLLPAAALSQEREPTSGSGEESSPLKLYQKFISGADGDRCPMYPSCSHYAQQAFKQQGLIKGWILSCDRLLRCGRDEKKISPSIQVNGKSHIYDPLEENLFWWKDR